MRAPRLTYANVMATIAVFIALGGASYAAIRIPANSVGQKQLRKKAVTNGKLAANAVTGDKVKDGSLNAADIDVNGLGLRDTCPTGTVLAYGLCAELKDHQTTQATYAQARQACSAAGGRPPTWFELDGLRQRQDIEWAAGAGVTQYEWTSDVLNAAAANRELIAIDQSGNLFGPAGPSNTLYYRCMIYPTNR